MTTNEATARDPNPVTALLALYRRIHRERMEGLPFLNNAIAVDVLEFRERGGRLSGLLITPWFVNFVLLPKSADEWSGLEPGTRRPWRLPMGEVSFTVDAEPAIGHYQMAPLMQPVTQLRDQGAAHAAARQLLARLFTPGAAPARPVAGRPAPPKREAVSRRGFLRAVWHRA